MARLKLFHDLKVYGLTDGQVWGIIDTMAEKKAREGGNTHGLIPPVPVRPYFEFQKKYLSGL